MSEGSHISLQNSNSDCHLRYLPKFGTLFQLGATQIFSILVFQIQTKKILGSVNRCFSLIYGLFDHFYLLKECLSEAEVEPCCLERRIWGKK